MRDSKTSRALARVDAGEAPYPAAVAEKLSPNTLYVAIKRRREKMSMTPCPCCGAMVEPSKINRDVLK